MKCDTFIVIFNLIQNNHNIISQCTIESTQIKNPFSTVHSPTHSITIFSFSTTHPTICTAQTMHATFYVKLSLSFSSLLCEVPLFQTTTLNFLPPFIKISTIRLSVPFTQLGHVDLAHSVLSACIALVSFTATEQEQG